MHLSKTIEALFFFLLMLIKRHHPLLLLLDRQLDQFLSLALIILRPLLFPRERPLKCLIRQPMQAAVEIGLWWTMSAVHTIVHLIMNHSRAQALALVAAAHLRHPCANLEPCVSQLNRVFPTFP